MSEDNSRLHEIVEQIMPDFLEREIASYKPAQTKESCTDATECAVSKALDWRRETVSMLELAKGFKTSNDFRDAITLREDELTRREANDCLKQDIVKFAAAKTKEDFQSAVDGICYPGVLDSQIFALKHTATMRRYLTGEMTDATERSAVENARLGSFKDISLKNARAALAQAGLLVEWERLSADKGQNPTPRLDP